MTKVYLRLAVETEERPERWVCRSPQLGFTVYGATRAAAEQEVHHALNALIGSFRADLAAIAQYLEHRNVEHHIQYDDAATAFTDGPAMHDGAFSGQGRTTAIRLAEVQIA